MPKKPEYIDLFAGCGGLSLGLHRAGWNGLFAIEKDEMAFRTLKHNLITEHKHFSWPKWLPLRQRSVRTLLRYNRNQLLKLRGKVPLIVGGPPCQGFSINGKRQPDDRRNQLVNSYISVVKLIQPRLLFFENVRGFTMEYMAAGSTQVYSDTVKKKLEALGYNVHAEIVDFSKFCVPQRRLRFILVGSRDGDAKAFFPLVRQVCGEYSAERGLRKKYSVSQAISDLRKSHGTIPSPDSPGFEHGTYGSARNGFQKLMRAKANGVPDSHRLVNHRKDTISTFKTILKTARRDKQLTKSFRQGMGIKKRSITPLAANAPAPTLTSLPDDLIHYEEPRVLTVREYARIQSFDDSYQFKGKYTSGGDLRAKEVPRYTQIGNAIPPIFAEQAGLALLRMLERDNG